MASDISRAILEGIVAMSVTFRDIVKIKIRVRIQIRNKIFTFAYNIKAFSDLSDIKTFYATISRKLKGE